MLGNAELEAAAEKLHQSYVEGRLRLVVGAGISVASGLPTWDSFCERILKEFFQVAESRFEPEPEEIEAYARMFAERFGREAVVDLLRDTLRDQAKASQRADHKESAEVRGLRQFLEIVRRALYRQRSLDLAPIQFEIAALVGGVNKPEAREIYTFNFDDLVERAMRDLHCCSPDDVGVIYDAETEKACAHKSLRVYHLHGVLPETPNTSTTNVVLSERDFLEAAQDHNWCDSAIQNLFRLDVDILLVGLSLTDPRLRRLLHGRAKAKQKSSDDLKARVYALFSSGPDREKRPLEQRHARRLVQRYEPDYWRSWHIESLSVGGHGLIPYVLRRIRLGANLHPSFDLGVKFLGDHSSVYGVDPYSDEVQRKAFFRLKRTIQFLRSRYAVAIDEELGVSMFVPRRDGDARVIRLTFSYREGFLRDGQRPKTTPETDERNKGRVATSERRRGPIQMVRKEWAARRSLAIETLTSQGVTGRAFAQGLVYQAEVTSAVMDENFTPDQRRDWASQRTFQWLWSIPVQDGCEWAGVGVICMTSNRKEAFWRRLEGPDLLDVERILRNLFRELMDYPKRQRTAGGPTIVPPPFPHSPTMSDPAATHAKTPAPKSKRSRSSDAP